MHEGAETPPAWPLEIAALDHLNVNAGLSSSRTASSPGRLSADK
jgi:hypothetical protein